MRCFKCSTENSENRKYCRECGSLVVLFCHKCGFHNSLSDKYCGCCGTGVLDINKADLKEKNSSEVSAGHYSSDDISELISSPSEGKNKKIKNKNAKDNEDVSQDLIDNIFSSENDKKNDNS